MRRRVYNEREAMYHKEAKSRNSVTNWECTRRDFTQWKDDENGTMVRGI